jgi:hypothetical protein
LQERKILGMIRAAATPEGYVIPVYKENAYGRRRRWAVVKVRARFGQFRADGTWVTKQPTMTARLADSELDAFTSEDQAIGGSKVKIDGLWGGLQPLFFVGQLAKNWGWGALADVEFRVLMHLNASNLRGTEPLDISWGAGGYSIDDLTEFAGRGEEGITFFVSVEGDAPAPAPTAGSPGGRFGADGVRPVTGKAQPSLRPLDETSADTRALTRWDPPSAAPPGALAVNMGRPPDPVESYRPPPWLPSEIFGRVARADYKVIVPTHLTAEKRTIGTGNTARTIWVPYGLGETDKDGNLIGLDPAAPLIFTATEGNPFPARHFVETSSAGVLAAILGEFAEMGLTLNVHDRFQIELAVKEAVAATSTLRAANDFTEVFRDKISRAVSASIGLRLVIDTMEARAWPPSYGTYTDTGHAAVTGEAKEFTWGWFLGLRPRFPFNVGHPYPNESPPADYDPAVNTPFTVTPQPQYGYRRQWPKGAAAERGGSDGRFGLNITTLAIGETQGYWLIEVKSWRHGYLSTYDLKHEEKKVPTTGHSVLAAKEATDLGLMPKALEVRPDFTIGYNLPAGTESTMGSDVIFNPPDTKFIARLLDSIEERLGSYARDLVAEEIFKVKGPRNTQAFLPQMVNGGLPIEVAVTKFYRLPIPWTGWQLPIPVLANRTIRILITARLDEAKFGGVIKTRHYLGERIAAESGQSKSRARIARHAVDPIRFWIIGNLKPEWFFKLATVWFNFTWTEYGETRRKTSLSRWQEDIRGHVSDTQDGAAVITRKVSWSYIADVNLAPQALVDILTFGLLQSRKRIEGPEVPEESSLVETRHDPGLLDRDFHPTLRDYLPFPLPAGPEPPHVAPASARPAWDPLLPHITAHPLAGEAAFPSLRRGLDLARAVTEHPHLLDEVHVVWPGWLTGLSGKITRLLLPPPKPYTPGLWGLFAAVLHNHIWNPQPGTGWFNPENLISSQAHILSSQAYVKSHLLEMLASWIAHDIVLPGRLRWPSATLLMQADVLEVHTARPARDVMTKRFHGNAETVTDGTERVAGTYVGAWVEPGLQEPRKRYDYTNILAPLITVDDISTDVHHSGASVRYSQEHGKKKTGLIFTQLFVKVRYRVGLVPAPIWSKFPGVLTASPTWFEEEDERVIELKVPTRDLPIWLSLTPVPAVSTVQAVQAEGPAATPPAVTEADEPKMPGAYPLPPQSGADLNAAADVTGTPSHAFVPVPSLSLSPSSPSVPAGRQLPAITEPSLPLLPPLQMVPAVSARDGGPVS